MKSRIPILISCAGTLFLTASCDDWPGVGDSDAGFAGGGRIEDSSGLLGSSCGSLVTCRTGLTCVTQAPGGLCTKACGSDDDCDQVGTCQFVPDWGGSVCLKKCSADSMCRTNYRCVSNGAASFCFESPGSSGDAG